MTKTLYKTIEAEMKVKMSFADSAHDENHVYRVLSNALLLCEDYNVQMDVLLAAVLLHDIGRQAEFENPHIDHAAAGADMAYDFLVSIGFPLEKCADVKKCILTHRFSEGESPQSIEARILYDADKLDLTGSMAIVRGIMAGEAYGEPLYVYKEDRSISTGLLKDEVSFMAFYNSHLKIVDERLFTPKARRLAKERSALVNSFYLALIQEVVRPGNKAASILSNILE